jgi:hypothetical protein
MKDGAIYLGSLSDMVRLHAHHRTSHVLITPLNENWGAFSTTVPHRTVDWGVWQDHLARAGCTPTMVRQYLDDPAVKAVVATNHTAFWHPKILALPIGISHDHASIEPFIHGDRPGKTQDLLISNSGWGHRAGINQQVISNFGGRIRNQYGADLTAYFRSIAEARFVLCPSGVGWDTYRTWETLTLGSIPIVEYSEGWHTVFDELPVLFVTNFDEVTPALLARAYPEILSQHERFDFGKLTKRWWASKITSLLAARN